MTLATEKVQRLLPEEALEAVREAGRGAGEEEEEEEEEKEEVSGRQEVVKVHSGATGSPVKQSFKELK